MDNTKISKRAGLFFGFLGLLTFSIVLSVLVIGWNYIPSTNIFSDNTIKTTGIAVIASPENAQTLNLSGARKVLEVVDGDTLSLEVANAKPEKIRLIGIDTPELKGKGGLPDCFAVNAKLALQQEIGNKNVFLEKDETQGELDKYGRTLAYVWVEATDNNINERVNLNLWQILQGNAIEYTYNKAYKYQAQFKAAEKSAQKQNLGIWNFCKIS